MSGYQTKLQRVAISGTDDLLIRSLLDRQQFDDPLGAAEREGISSASWSLFGLLWPSGIQLAVQLAQREVRAGEKILEIGCGLALASLVAHRRGADVTASDCHPLAESFLNENLLLNNLPSMKYRHGRWGAPASPDSDERDVTGRFELIIGSDVLYERDDNALLASFIAQHAANDGEVWIVDPDRSNRAAFNKQMASRGFVMNERRLDRAATVDAPAYKGRLLIYKRE
jgi:predicted nicotinamide N-methyase